MIHFKVIRASRLLLTLAILLLIAVLALIGIRVFIQPQPPAASGSARLVDAGQFDEAKTETVFASSGEGDSLDLDPGSEAMVVEVIDTVREELSKPRILIYHTHTHEAYEQEDGDRYEALEAWRTMDAVHSVVRVGEALAQQLQAYGFEVIHDTTDNEGDQLSTAYTRSLAMLKNYDRPFDVYIDLHRDAWTEGEPVAFTSQNGSNMARLMLLIGNGNGFDEKPWFEQNYAFATALVERINRTEPNLCKPVLVKDGRYNQHIGVFSVLVEVGHNRNTLHQALNSVPPLARAVYSLIVEEPDPELVHMKAVWEKGHTHTDADP